MKFLYIFCYVLCYANIAQLCHLATFCAYGVGLFSPVALLVFRYCSKLMVRHKVGLYEHCYGVVYGSAAHTELYALLEVLHKLFYLETAVDGVYCVKDGKTLRCTPAFVLLQIFGKYLVDNIHNLAVLHISPVPRADTDLWSWALPDAPVPMLRLS